VCRLQNVCPSVLFSCSSTALRRRRRRRNAVRRLPTKLGQMSQQLLQICRKGTSIENENFKTFLEMAVLVLLKICCAGWKAKKQKEVLRTGLGISKLLHVSVIYAISSFSDDPCGILLMNVEGTTQA